MANYNNPYVSKDNINNQMQSKGAIDKSFDKNLDATTQTIGQSVENLKESTINSSISSVWTKSDLMIEQKWIKYKNNIHSLVWFLSSTDKLLEEISNIKSWISKKWLDKAWKQAMNNAKFTLNQYEKQIKDKQKALLKQKWAVTIYDGDIKNLQNIRWIVNKIKEDLATRWQWGEPWNPELPYNSLKNAKKSNERQIDMLKFNQNLQEETKQWAILRIFNWNAQNLTDFYRRIAQWEYSQADYELYTRNVSVLWPSLQRCGISTPIVIPGQNINTWWIQIEQQSPWNSSIDYNNMSLWEAFERWWLAWVIDKWLGLCKNMTPWQRNTWRNLTVLWGVAAWLFWLYKFYTSKKSFIKKAWITAAVIFWSQALTWEWPISLFTKLLKWWFSKDYFESKFWNTFWDAINWIWNSWTECSNTIAPAMCSMMVFNPGTTVWNVNTMTQSFKTDPNSRKDFRFQAIDKLKNKYWTKSSEYFSATFPNNFDEEKRNNRLASFGVTEITDTSKANVSIYELANNASMNEIIIEKFRTEHWVKETSNDVKKKEFEEYVSNLKKTNKAIDIKDLENHPEWFELDKNATYTERVVDNQFKDTLVSQTESRGINEPKKSELKSAIRRFYDERTIDSKPILSDFSLKLDNGMLILKSHNWQETKIDINKNEIVGFWNGIRFSDLSELLNVADITNKILESQKWNVAINYPPFEYKTIWKKWRWIYFNDANGWSFNFDTRVLSGGWWWVMWKIDTLWNHPEEFAKYLSDRWMKINPTSQINKPASQVNKQPSQVNKQPSQTNKPTSQVNKQSSQTNKPTSK